MGCASSEGGLSAGTETTGWACALCGSPNPHQNCGIGVHERVDVRPTSLVRRGLSSRGPVVYVLPLTPLEGL